MKCFHLGCPIPPLNSRVSHCSGGCHRTFSGVSAFDRHQTFSEETGSVCHDPSARGLVQRADGVWRWDREFPVSRVRDVA